MIDLISEGLFGSFSAIIFTISIASLFLFSCLVMLFPGKRQWVISKAPSLLTTLGLFGTFCGIAVGLGEFDVSNIDQSVIKLLGGMKLAFWTSILGMLGAFIIHILQYICGCFVETEDLETEILYDIYDTLQKQNPNADNSLAEEIRQFKDVSAQMNQNIIQGFESLQSAFANFANKMAENNSRALVVALEGVVRDFNARINEQFGDNFRKLNQAVGKLLEWQENYRVHLENLTRQIETSVVGIEASSKGIENIKSNLDALPIILSNLRKVIIAIDNGLKESSETLKAFIALRNQASEVFPIIQKGVDDLTRNLTASIQDAVNAFETSTKKQSQIIGQLGKTTVEITGSVQTALREGADEVQTVFNDAAKKMGDSTSNLFETFNQETEKSLTAIIQLMGNNLASIHAKLIYDCKELMEQFTLLAESRNR